MVDEVTPLVRKSSTSASKTNKRPKNEDAKESKLASVEIDLQNYKVGLNAMDVVDVTEAEFHVTSEAERVLPSLRVLSTPG